MYIGHYKSVSSSEEFYSEKRDSLDFPTQVELNSVRYMLVRSIQVSTPSQLKNVLNTAKAYSIPFDIKVEGP